MPRNISEKSSFKFEYKNNDKKQWFDVNQENLQVHVAENIVYFLVKVKFSTGSSYSFRMSMESSNGDTDCFGYDDHYVRGESSVRYQSFFFK